jgi:hypothetical protein
MHRIPGAIPIAQHADLRPLALDRPRAGAHTAASPQPPHSLSSRAGRAARQRGQRMVYGIATR